MSCDEQENVSCDERESPDSATNVVICLEERGREMRGYLCEGSRITETLFALTTER
jgi:hypothetical protein